MGWIITWSTLQSFASFPAIKIRSLDGTYLELIPLSLFDLKVFQCISIRSRISLVKDLQELRTFTMTLYQSNAMNDVIQSDCVNEYGCLRLANVGEELVNKDEFPEIIKKILDLREREFVTPRDFNLFSDIRLMQFGWCTINNHKIPYVQRDLVTLVPKKLMLLICNVSDDEDMDGWVSSASEALLILYHLQSAGYDIQRQDIRHLVSLHQAVNVFRHKIFNGPTLRDIQIPCPTVFVNLVSEFESSIFLPALETDGIIAPGMFADGFDAAAAGDDNSENYLNTQRISLLILRKIEIIRTCKAMTYCLAHVQNCETNMEEALLPCFWRPLIFSETVILVNEVRRYLFPLWTTKYLVLQLRHNLQVRKLVILTKRLNEYVEIFKPFRIDLDETNELQMMGADEKGYHYCVDVKALLASLMLLKMKYRDALNAEDVESI